jgi:hypothetical protein
MQTPQRLTLDEFSADFQFFLRKHAADPRLRTRIAFISIHDERFGRQCAGRGSVWKIAIPYLDGSEEVPEEQGCLHVEEPLLEVGVILDITRETPPKESHWILRLNDHQRSALLGLLIEHMREPEATREWVDVLTDSTVTIGDLLMLVSMAEVDR